VLGKFGPADRKIIDIVVAEAVNAAAKIIGEGADAAMNLYNGWSAALQEGT
jgi:peptidyl-tRNA hydrolase